MTELLPIDAVITADATVNIDQLVQVDPTSVGFAVTLPNAKFCNGRKVIVANIGASTNTVTVTASHSQNINGASTLAMTTAYGVKTLVSNGTNWIAY